ncbi:MAG: hypothetical protein RID07_08500, partial [Lacipirellulaceae bacterium]
MKSPSTPNSTPDNSNGQVTAQANPAQMTNRRVLELMTALQQAANERAEAEANIQATYGTRIEKIEQLFQSSQSQVAEQHLKRRRELENEYGEAKREAAARFQSEK